jgi:hypothetical protein
MPIIENSSGDGSLGDCLAKNKFGTDMLGLLSPKTSLNLARALAMSAEVTVSPLGA